MNFIGHDRFLSLHHHVIPIWPWCDVTWFVFMEARAYVYKRDGMPHEHQPQVSALSPAPSVP
jgi:hypothetical protein